MQLVDIFNPTGLFSLISHDQGVAKIPEIFCYFHRVLIFMKKTKTIIFNELQDVSAIILRDRRGYWYGL